MGEKGVGFTPDNYQTSGQVAKGKPPDAWDIDFNTENRKC
jgi:hypothetical protein